MSENEATTLTTSDHPTSDNADSDYTASSQATSGQATSSHPASGQATSNHPASGQATSNHPASGQATLSHPASGQATLNHPASGQATSNHPASGQATSSHPALGQATLNHPASGQATSNHPASGQATSSHPASGQATSSHPASGQANSSNPTSGQVTSNHPTSGNITSNPSVLNNPASDHSDIDNYLTGDNDDDEDYVPGNENDYDDGPNTPELYVETAESSDSNAEQELPVASGTSVVHIDLDSSRDDSNQPDNEVTAGPADVIIIAEDDGNNSNNSNNHGPTAENVLPQQNSTPPPSSASDTDFRSPKRRRIESPAKPNHLKEGDSQDDETCSICFEPWTTSGNHRPASLKCGHLFGESCIDKWLRGQGDKCPHCNCKAKRSDIRVVFSRNIRAVDTIERDRALQELAQSKQRNAELKMELAELGCKYQLDCSKLLTELKEAQNEIKFLRSRLMGSSTGITTDISLSQENSVNKSQEASGNGQYRCIKTILIWEGGNCRVMAYSPFLGILVVSQPSSIPLFQGFGVRKISTVDFRTTEYIPLHSKLIRSMSFHPTYSDGLLLSCAMDKKIKLTSLISNTVVQQYEVPLPAWSCVWNTDDHNYFFAGIQNGLVLEYDVRKTDTFIQQINTEGSRSPVVSLQYIPAAPFAHFRAGGLLVGQLDRISFYERKPNNKYEVHLLPLEGNLTSLFFETHTRQLLASFRNSTKFPKVRHMVCEMTANVSDDHNICSCNVIQTFHGSSPQTLLSRTSLVKHPNDKNRLLICANEELACAVNIWDGKTFQYVQKLSCGSPVLDICSISTKDNHYLLALTEKQVKLHKWSES
ncbi:E3 ubiquitin-protein ligase RFWD3 isoform X3 [Octopus sinensis]|uniref:RING-type E3 ubiquitin transferase n=1 Tax=Octopus sinensis TaxID=2607531 RepID=A0A7E6FFA6_9MOLL|nr:E3 ubiquitin-protein ligase RFWD3 isoform X2 [Octopus sinensis]XP_036366020.1 E3 ubiquitin-protein ligase RFWD3 isoform X3 [Octopus sinensis]